jgi:hypothetical protein
MKKLLIILSLGLLIVGGTGSSRLVKHLAEEGVEVDGVRLKHRRTIELEVELDERLIYYAHVGDIRIRPGDGDELLLSIELIEYEPGDGEAYLGKDGKVRTRTRSEKPCVLGTLRAEVPEGLSLDLSSGLGDIEVMGMKGSERIVVESGMGDLVLEDLDGVGMVDAETGMGEILVGPCWNLESVDLSSGMGSIKVREVTAEFLEADTGMGGIRLTDCKFETVYGSTGMGSIRVKDTHYEDSDFDTGMGSIKYH